MALLINQGGFKAADHVVTGDPAAAEGRFTRAWVRILLGLGELAEVVAFQVRDPDTFQPDGYVFAQKPAAAHGSGKLPNLRASCLCGNLLYGQAVHVPAGEPIEWKPG